MDMKNTISQDMLTQFEKNYEKRPELGILHNAIARTKLDDAAFVAANAAKLRMDFSVVVNTTKITNQKQSGRCWQFATMNVMRERVIKKCNMKDFAISGVYTTFFDKLEKCNNFFEAIIDFAKEDINSRNNTALLQNPLPDGGQWDMAVGILKKYGCVPSWVMPETVHSSGTAQYTPILERKLREDALELRRLVAEGSDPQPRRTEMLQEMYNALCILYGKPPKTFDFEYTDKDGTYHEQLNMTPKSFFEEYVGDDIDDYVCILAVPDRPTGEMYSQPHMSNLIEVEMKWPNYAFEELEDLAIRQLESGEVVFFSCDCRNNRERNLGYWDMDSFQHGEVLGGLTFNMNKKERLQTFESTMNHCMVLCGVNLNKDHVPNRWKIENSWGEKAGQDGYFVCSEKWFKENVYQIVVRKSLLSEEQLAVLEKEPIPMELWDPLA